MNGLYLMLAIGFGYWIGNAKSPQVVVDLSKCPIAIERPLVWHELEHDDPKPKQPVTVEPIKEETNR
jgi:hypothetical protein